MGLVFCMSLFFISFSSNLALLFFSKVLVHDGFFFLFFFLFFNLKAGPPLQILASPLWKMLHRQKEPFPIPQSHLSSEDSAWYAGGSLYLLTESMNNGYSWYWSPGFQIPNPKLPQFRSADINTSPDPRSLHTYKTANDLIWGQSQICL